MTDRRRALMEFNQRRRDEWVASVARGLAPGSRVLDVGAGIGRYRLLFAHCRYQAQDFGDYHGTTEGLMREKWEYAPLDYVCDATHIPVGDQTFDAVLCTEVLEHVPEPIEVLREISRIVRAGGAVFISAPLGSGLHQEPHHFYGGFTPHFYHRFLPQVGFGNVNVQPNGGFFRMLLQELCRGAEILSTRGGDAALNPMRWLLPAVRSGFVVRWLTALDEAIPVNEFTVGYHIEATRLSEGPSGRMTPTPED